MLPDESIQVFSDKYLENISDAFRTLYIEEQLSDVTIYCKHGHLKAHKLILAANSPYFYKIFKENRNDYPIIVLHGVTLIQLKNLMDLLYQGIVDVQNCDVDAMSSLVTEFEIKGVVFGQKSSHNVRMELNQHSQISPESAHNRDTRYKGQKRVAVDYVHDGNSHLRSASSSSICGNESKISKKINQGDVGMPHYIDIKREMPSPIPSTTSSNLSESLSISEKKSMIGHGGIPKLNAWARKQRKFKCNLCPSSFKRSSHLSRHQLVHTGERPYACTQCDKAFSRHDKLKHHIRKTHEFIPDSMYERLDIDDINEESEPEMIRKNYPSPSLNNDGPSTSINPEFISVPSSQHLFHRENSPLFTVSHITSILEDSFVSPPKKGRGRPRKYPPAPVPLVKRGRGRPRQNQTGPFNFNIAKLPYGNLNYLANLAAEKSSCADDEPVMLEPLVEINMDQGEMPKLDDSPRPTDQEEIDIKEEVSTVEPATIEPIMENSRKEAEEQSSQCIPDIDITEIENRIGLIGECTISVAN